MSDHENPPRNLVPRLPDAIIPADRVPDTLVKTAKRALPVAGGALLMWAGRRAFEAAAAYAQRRANSPADIEIHMPERRQARTGATRDRRIVKRAPDTVPADTAYAIEYRYTARWTVIRRSKDHDTTD